MNSISGWYFAATNKSFGGHLAQALVVTFGNLRLSSASFAIATHSVKKSGSPWARLWPNLSSVTKELTRHRSGPSLSTTCSIMGQAP